MVNAVALPASDCDHSSARRAPSIWHVELAPLLALLPDAVLLGLLRVFALTVAPKHGFYFTTEAFLIVYACFAVVRAVHIGANSHDGLGRYSPQLARRARQAFYAGLRRQPARIALVVLALLLAALSLDMLTAGTGTQFRLNVHLTVMLLELAAWLRYGSMLAIASARWVPSRRPSFARARVLVSKQRSAVARALWPAHILICVAALSSLAAYGGRAGVMVLGGGNPRLVLCWTAALCACLAWLALARLSYGSLAVLQNAGKRRAA
jgi:hypothetical protein